MRAETDNSGLSKALQADLGELDQGLPLVRHSWLQEILDNPNIGPNSYGQNPPRDVVLRAMLARMSELTALAERDMELETATVALGFKFTSGPDVDGGRYVYEWVRAKEVYEDLRNDWEVHRGEDPKVVRSDIVGIGSIYAGYALGSQRKGLGEENNDRWFMSFRASGVHVHIPFDAITEVVDSSTQTYTHSFRGGPKHELHYGSVIESPTNRSAMFHGWLQREAASI